MPGYQRKKTLDVRTAVTVYTICLAIVSLGKAWRWLASSAAFLFGIQRPTVAA